MHTENFQKKWRIFYQQKTKKKFKIVLKGFHAKLNIKYIISIFKKKNIKNIKIILLISLKIVLQFCSTIYYNIYIIINNIILLIY